VAREFATWCSSRGETSAPSRITSTRPTKVESELAARGKSELLELIRNIIPKSVNCIYIRQPEPLGLGHAVLCAQPAVNDQVFAVILAMT